jgi:chromosome segregation ATPase
VQIVLDQLQIQDAAVGRASQRLDNTHNRCAALDGSRQHISADIARFQSALDSGTLQESVAKDIQASMTKMKTDLESQTAEAQSCQTAEAEASGQLQREQSKFTELQDRIERLDDSLKKVSGTQ